MAIQLIVTMEYLAQVSKSGRYRYGRRVRVSDREVVIEALSKALTTHLGKHAPWLDVSVTGEPRQGHTNDGKRRRARRTVSPSAAIGESKVVLLSSNVQRLSA